MPPGLTNDGVVVRRERSSLDFGLHVHGDSPFLEFGTRNKLHATGLTNDGVVVRCELSGLDLRFHVHGYSPFVEFGIRNKLHATRVNERWCCGSMRAFQP